jgi:hypothetical protein
MPELTANELKQLAFQPKFHFAMGGVPLYPECNLLAHFGDVYGTARDENLANLARAYGRGTKRPR